MARIKKEGGENMLEVKKVTTADSGSKKKHKAEEQNLSNPPCQPETGICPPGRPPNYP